MCDAVRSSESYSRWGNGGQAQPLPGSRPAPAVIADGETGAKRNDDIQDKLVVRVIADGETGAKRNEGAVPSWQSMVIADGETGAKRNSMARRLYPPTVIADGETGAKRNANLGSLPTRLL